MKEIILSSTNVAKRLAVERIVARLGIEAKVSCIDVDSGVAATPMSDDEGIRGAMQRIEAAQKKIANADYYVGLEGIITHNTYGSFLCGWAVVKSGDAYGMGCSAKVQLPPEVTAGLDETMQLREKVAMLYPDMAEKMPEIGTNGIITKGQYTRVDEFEDALVTAFSVLPFAE